MRVSEPRVLRDGRCHPPEKENNLFRFLLLMAKQKKVDVQDGEPLYLEAQTKCLNASPVVNYQSRIPEQLKYYHVSPTQS